MLVPMKQLLLKAQKGRYAVGAFNINNMEVFQAVVNASRKLKSPVIIQTSEGAINYAGLDILYHIASIVKEMPDVKASLHLDHGKDLDLIKKCVNIGYTSVMIDGSHFRFWDNIKITKKVVEFAHKKGVSVEGELGTIGGAEDLVSSRKIIYTDPNAAKEFVEQTGVDALAVAIGTSHGAYKFEDAAKLDIERLKLIHSRVKIPLVLHGASGVPSWLVSLASKYGAKLGKPEGVPDQQIKEAIKNGVCKINTDTDLRLAFDAAVRKTITEHPEDFDPRHILGPARDLIQQVVEARMRLFGSVNKK